MQIYYFYFKKEIICVLFRSLDRYATPVTDLVYYIFGCTTKSLRDKHYHEFFDVYHAELSNYMRRYEIRTIQKLRQYLLTAL